MKKSIQTKKSIKYWAGFGFVMFLIMAFVDFVNDQEIIWSENILITLLTIMIVSFVDWAWDSKDYNKKS
ncbi:hypothetical protein [Jeotgalibacillus sp. JSM ZJ347]|uniref:hypothetical protein n=1 Tax=Jeotgalibacillus sp. JSM ZJ347 TaxID=3342117 RepID=UPI0035A83877